MEPHHEDSRETLPDCAARYVSQVTKRMRYRRRARAEVGQELAAHFEDALKDCENAVDREAKARKLVEQLGSARLMAVLCRRAKKRCRPLWQKVLVRGLAALGLFFLYLILCSLPMVLGRPTIRINHAEWLSQRWRPSATGVENARTYYDRATQLYVVAPDGLQLRMQRSDWAVSDCNEAELHELQSWLAANEPTLDMLRRGAAVPAYWPTYDANVADTSNPDFMQAPLDLLSDCRAVARALGRQIEYNIRRGSVSEAFDDCLVLMRFGRHMEGKGMLVEQLVGIALEALGIASAYDVMQEPNIPLGVLIDAQQRVAAAFNPGGFAINLDAEKAIWHDRIQRSFTDDGQGGGHALGRGIPYAAGDWRVNLLRTLVFDYPDRRETQAMVDANFDRIEADMAVPPWESRSVPDAGISEQTPASTLNLLLAITTPAYERLKTLMWRLKTSETALVTNLAIMRYRAETGEYPVDLDALVTAGYLTAVPDDPFGPGPLTYRRTADGFLLYSWGENLADDGGKLGTRADGEPRMWSDDGDWVFWPVPDVQT